MLRKPPKIVSKAIRASAEGELCTMILPGCKGREGVVCCHINSPSKGMRTKSPDLFVFFGCWHCHQLQEAGKASKADELRAMMRTQIRLYQKGLIDVKL